MFVSRDPRSKRYSVAVCRVRPVNLLQEQLNSFILPGAGVK